MLRRSLGIVVVLVLSAAVGCTTTAPFITGFTGLPPSITIPATVVLTASGGPGSSRGLWTWIFSTTCGGTFTSTTTPNNGPANPIIIGPTDAKTVQVTYDSTGATPGPCTFTVKLVTASGRSATLSATTTIDAQTLTVTKTGTGTGTVTSSPPGINCGTVCMAGFDDGTVVTLTATPDAGSKFDGWSGDPDCSDGQVTMDADKTCTATFTLLTAGLSLTKVDAPDPVTYGSNVTYTLTVSNNGPDPATNVTLTDTLPTNVIFVSATPSQGTCSGTTTITCNLGTINNGANATVTIVVQAKATGVDLVVDDDTGTCAYTGTVADTASVTATEPDPVPGDNTASASTTISANHSTISAAIAAASAGQKIFVCPGTYTEQLSIDKSLTLAGAGAATTIVKAPSAASRTTYTIPESAATWDPIVFARGTGASVISVAISGFTIDGQNNYGSTSTRYVGILYRNVKPGTISSNVVKDLGHDGTPTFGIMVYGDSDVTISSNQVSNYGRGGIGVNGDIGPNPDPTAVIQGNTVTGPGAVPQTWAPNGIQIAWGATGTIKDNEVIGNIWPGASWAGTGIGTFDSNNVIVQGNNVHDNENGIVVGGYYGTASGLQVKNNIVDKNDWGIQVINNAVNTVVEDNTVTNQNGDGIDVWNYGWGSPDPTGTEVHNNIIVNSGYDGAWTNVTAEVVDMESNWWGDASGPYDAADDAGETIEVPSCTTSPASEINTDGLGDSAADTSTTAIDYCPWLNAAPFGVSITAKPQAKPPVRSGDPSVVQPIE